MTHRLHEEVDGLVEYSRASGILRMLKADKEGRPIKLRVTKDANEDSITKELEKEGWGQINAVTFPKKTTAEIDWVDWDAMD